MFQRGRGFRNLSARLLRWPTTFGELDFEAGDSLLNLVSVDWQSRMRWVSQWCGLGGNNSRVPSFLPGYDALS